MELLHGTWIPRNFCSNSIPGPTWPFQDQTSSMKIPIPTKKIKPAILLHKSPDRNKRYSNFMYYKTNFVS